MRVVAHVAGIERFTPSFDYLARKRSARVAAHHCQIVNQPLQIGRSTREDKRERRIDDRLLSNQGSNDATWNARQENVRRRCASESWLSAGPHLSATEAQCDRRTVGYSLPLRLSSHRWATAAASLRRPTRMVERRRLPSLSLIDWRALSMVVSERRLGCQAVSAGEKGGDGDVSTVTQVGAAGTRDGLAADQAFLTIPTLLTLCRVAAVPALLLVYYVPESWAAAAGALIFLAAALTDWLDGFLARKMGTSSAFGAFLDPVADKLMVATVLVLLCSRPPASGALASYPWLLPLPSILIIGREITMSALREWAASQGEKMHQAVAVNNLGKWKTATQMIALTLLLAIRDQSFFGFLVDPGFVIGAIFLYLSAALAAWSLVVYIRGIWQALA